MDLFGPAVVGQFKLREEWVAFNLINARSDCGGSCEPVEQLDAEVAHAAGHVSLNRLGPESLTPTQLILLSLVENVGQLV